MSRTSTSTSTSLLQREEEDDGMPVRDLCEGTKAGQHMSHDGNFYPVRSSVSVAAHRLHGGME